MTGLLLIALTLACFELVVLWFLPLTENTPPAEENNNDDNGDGMPFGPAPARDANY